MTDHHADDREQVAVAVLTVSSSRTLDDDPSGDAAAALLSDAGHAVERRELVRDDYDRVQSVVHELIDAGAVDAVVSTGGTGVTPDDVTPEAVDGLLDKRLPGFGERFRRLSAEEVGAREQLSRAVGGVADGTPIFCLPGSENAVRLGVEECIVPILGHVVGHATRDPDEEDESPPEANRGTDAEEA